MENQQLINVFWDESVKGLNQELLEDKDMWYSYVINLPIKLQVTYNVCVLHEQVFNGGLHQYFLNSFGQFAYVTLDNLNLIKAYKTEEILEAAVNKVNREGYELNEFRRKIFNEEIDRLVDFEDELADFLDKLTDEYYALEEDLEQLLADFLRK